jgi:hypothetical protein
MVAAVAAGPVVVPAAAVPVEAQAAVELRVGVELQVGRPAVAEEPGVLVVSGPVELAPREQVLGRELVAGRELAALVAADTAMMLDLLTPVHTDGLTRTASDRGCIVSKGVISLGLVAAGLGLVTLGLVASSLAGITNGRSATVGLSGGRRRTCAIITGLTTRSG